MATFTVTNLNDSGPGSLRDAINQANATTDDDIIEFQSGLTGTISLTSGELLISDSVTILGLGADQITIDGGGDQNFRIFNIDDGNANNGGDNDPDETIIIEGLTITGGDTPPRTLGFDNAVGGGIRNTEDTLILRSVVVTDNQAFAQGGGIFNEEGALEIYDSTISNNSARRGQGGGITNFGGELTIVNSTISDNFALDGGGGISTVFGETAITNSTIVNNTSAGLAAGVSVAAGEFTLTSSIIANNEAVEDPDPVDGQTSEPTQEEIDSRDLLFQTDAQPALVSFNSGGNNLIGAGYAGGLDVSDTIFVDGVDGDIVGTSENPIDPGLGALQDNGGSTPTHALLESSVAIDAGSNPENLGFDQRGTGFDRESGGTADIGAYEVQVPSVIASITIVKDDLTGSENNFVFGLVFEGVLEQQIVLSDGESQVLNLAPGTYQVSEFLNQLPEGYVLEDIVIDTDDSSDTSSVEGNVATLDLDPGEDITVTFVNDAAPNPSIELEKKVNGQEANDPSNPVAVGAGDDITYTYELSNTGNVELTGFEIIDDNGTPGDTSDDFVYRAYRDPAGNLEAVGPEFEPFDGTGDTNGDRILDPGETWTFSSTTRPAEPGLITNEAEAKAVENGDLTIPALGISNPDASNTDSASYEGTAPTAIAADFAKLVNGEADTDADNPLAVTVGDDIVYTYEVTNTGTEVLGDGLIPLQIVDDNGTPDDISDDLSFESTAPGIIPDDEDGISYTSGDTDGDGLLDPGETWILTADTQTAEAGLVTNVADFKLITTTFQSDTASYEGSEAPTNPGIEIEKFTNGVDADTADLAATVAAGDPITWTYEVTNTGDVAFAENDVSVTDDQGLVPVLDASSDVGSDGLLSPGETWTYTASGTAANLNTIVDFEQFSQGDVITVINSDLTASTPDPNGLLIFDTGLIPPSGGDDDLGTPNQDFGGGGIGAGGAAGQPGENSIPQGMALIISEDGDVTDPDDDAIGGLISFTWDDPVRVNQVGILDIDTNEPGGTIETFDANGNLLGTYALETLGDNSYQVVLIGDVDVSRMDVNLVSSGAVTEINYDEVYTNIGTVTAGGVTDTDPSNYLNGFDGPLDPQPQGDGGSTGGGDNGGDNGGTGDPHVAVEVGLYDAHTDQLITLINPNGTTTVQKADIEGLDLTIAAYVADGSGLTVESMKLDFNGGQFKQLENVEPYALFGDTNGDFRGRELDLHGSNTVSLDLFAGNNGHDFLKTIERTFQVVEGQSGSSGTDNGGSTDNGGITDNGGTDNGGNTDNSGSTDNGGITDNGILKVGLFDADTDTLIQYLSEGTTTHIDASDIAGRDVTIAAYVPGTSTLVGQVGSMHLDLNNGQETQTENVEPFALFGDSNGDFNGGGLEFFGLNTVSFDLYSGSRKSGTLLDSLDFAFEVVNGSTGGTSTEGSTSGGSTEGSTSGSSTGGSTSGGSTGGSTSGDQTGGTSSVGSSSDPLTGGLAGLQIGLYDAKSDSLIATLQDGSQISANLLTSDHLSIAALVTDSSQFASPVESMVLNLNNGAVTNTENVEPYALFGDNSGDFRSGSIPTGPNTIALDLFDKDGGNGDLLETVALNFSIVA